jgi:hypothetical protein
MMIDVKFKGPTNSWEVSFDGQVLIDLPLLMEEKAYQLQENINRLFEDMMFFDIEEEEDDEDMADK